MNPVHKENKDVGSYLNQYVEKALFGGASEEVATPSIEETAQEIIEEATETEMTEGVEKKESEEEVFESFIKEAKARWNV